MVDGRLGYLYVEWLTIGSALRSLDLEVVAVIAPDNNPSTPVLTMIEVKEVRIWDL